MNKQLSVCSLALFLCLASFGAQACGDAEMQMQMQSGIALERQKDSRQNQLIDDELNALRKQAAGDRAKPAEGEDEQKDVDSE